MKHNGLSSTREYYIWKAMIRRCYNPKDKKYPAYGGRGITVCDRWRGSFLAFYEDMGEKPDGLSINRINNNGNYEPSNCEWATSQAQAVNQRKRNTNTSGYKGVTWDKENRKWIAQICVDGKHKNLGRFISIEVAAKTYNEASLRYFNAANT